MNTFDRPAANTIHLSPAHMSKLAHFINLYGGPRATLYAIRSSLGQTPDDNFLLKAEAFLASRLEKSK